MKLGPRAQALSVRELSGIWDQGLLEGDRLPTAALLHVDPGEHDDGPLVSFPANIPFARDSGPIRQGEGRTDLPTLRPVAAIHSVASRSQGLYAWIAS